MSFSLDAKLEIYKNLPKSLPLKKAQCLGLLCFSKVFNAGQIEFVSEQRTPARLFSDYIAQLIGISGSITIKESRRKNGKLYAVSLDSVADCQKIFEFFEAELPQINEKHPEKLQQFLAGAFLACGSVTNPQKDYHLEFVLPAGADGSVLENTLKTLVGEPKTTIRRQNTVLYYKESESIEDVLTICGAVGASMTIMQTKMVKEVRNTANRLTNCETANISKTVKAAVEQTENIKLIFSALGEGALPDDLLEIAKLRLENPEMSLRELGESLKVPLSRSGVHHRLKRLDEMAAGLKFDLN